MGYKLHDLPPLKRLRIMHQDPTSPTLLPAKKRKESRYQSPDFSDSASSVADTTTATCWLPTKKRVWAPPPEFIPKVDLNVEYKPTVGDGSFDLDREEKEGEEDKLIEVRFDVVIDDRSCDRDSDAVERQDDDREDKGDDELVEIGVKIVHDELWDADCEAIEGVEEEEDGIVCAICDSTDGDPTDPIVFCDGCDLTVHASCYGNPLIKAIPEGDWFCSQCIVSKSCKMEKNFSCCLCPVTGGAMKPTNDGRWAHIVCALFVPEVFFEDPEGREGINCSEVPKRRWKERCYVCEGKNGCAIECSEVNCGLGFHVSCGLKEGLCIEYRKGKRKGGIVAGFCKMHTALWEQQKRTGKFRIVAAD